MNYPLFGLILLPILVSIFMIIHYLKIRRARRHIEQLEKVIIEKDKLFTVIGHDLNGMINSTLPALQLYRSDYVTPEERETLLDGIEERLYLASDTLQSLLNWGKLQLKGMTLNLEYFNAAEVINHKLSLTQAVTRHKALKIANLLPSEVNIYADINHFRFIMRNLLANAIKYSRAGGTIDIEMMDFYQPGFIVFSVKDSGIGMNREKLREIFKPYNASTEGTAEEKGNGIGLILCKEYAKKNGGDVWAESEEGIGTTFYLALKASNHDYRFLYGKTKLVPQQGSSR